MIETFPRDSLFIKNDTRTERWAVPYHYAALNSRVENLIIENRKIIKNKKILDLGCHFGTMAFACLKQGADFVCGVDNESSLISQAKELFKIHKVPNEKYNFFYDDVITCLKTNKEQSFDTVLCLGLFYYLNEPLHLLKLMKQAAKYIILDTFTAYYGATVAKERKKVLDYTKPETFELPLVMYPLTQAKKKDYLLKNHFKRKNKKSLSMLALPTIPALENFFNMLHLKYTPLSWEKYVVNDYTWQDFIGQDNKMKAHWADVYHTKIRVSYLLGV